MVTVTNLTMRFGSRVLFDHVNLKLDQHKRYGLIGANGAGKTTFLKILSGQIDEFDGTVTIGAGLKVGVLEQNQFAYEDYTILMTMRPMSVWLSWRRSVLKRTRPMSTMSTSPRFSKTSVSPLRSTTI
jgi:ATPase subunit of ABC transporter with duplicated ATPase domains